MKRITILSKLLLLIILMNSGALVAQNWNFHRPLANLTVQKEIRTLVNGKAYLLGEDGFYMRNWQENQWNYIDYDFLLGDVYNEKSFFSVSKNIDAIYYSSYGKSGGMGLLANYVNSTTPAYYSIFEFDISPCGYCFGNPSTAIVANGSTVVTAVDGMGRFYKSTDYGTSWYENTTYSTLSTPTNIETGDFIGNNSYLFASKQGNIYLSTNGAATFQLTSTQAFGFKKVKKAFGNEIYAITHQIPETAIHTIRKSIDNGLTWSIVNTNLPAQKFNTLEFDGNWLYLAGDSGVYSLSGSNATWVNETHNLNTSSFKSVSYVGGKLFCVTGNTGDFPNQVFSRDEVAGANWEAFDQGIYSKNGLESIVGNKLLLNKTKKNKFYVESATGWEARTASGLYETNDISQLVTDNLGVLYLLHSINDDQTAVIKKSTDGGNTFQTYSSSLLGNIHILARSNNGKIVITKDHSSIYLYDTNTSQQTLLYQINTLTHDFSSAFIHDNGTIYIGYTNNGGSGFNFIKTTNNGASFTTVNLVDDFLPYKLVGNYIYQSTTNNRLNITSDSIETYTTPAGTGLLIDIMKDNGFIFALSEGANPNETIIHRSNNGGLTWETNSFTTTHPGNYNIQSTYNGDAFIEVLDPDPTKTGVFKWSSALKNIEFTNNNFTLYPNPAKDILNISGASALKSVSVFNMLGQQVLTEHTNSTNTYQLNISKLAQGTYLVKVEGEQASQTIKVIKE